MLAECTQLQLLSQIRLYLDCFLGEMFQTMLNGLKHWPNIVKGGPYTCATQEPVYLIFVNLFY